MHDEKEGAFTGEVSAQQCYKTLVLTMLCLVIPNVVNISMKQMKPSTKKCMLHLIIKLTPIVCVGETLEERESKTKQLKYVANQVKEAFEGIQKKM